MCLFMVEFFITVIYIDQKLKLLMLKLLFFLLPKNCKFYKLNAYLLSAMVDLRLYLVHLNEFLLTRLSTDWKFQALLNEIIR